MENKNIQVEMTQDDLLVIIGTLIKSQRENMVVDKKMLDLVARLSVQAIDKVEFDKLDKK